MARLSREARREQLLGFGAAMITERGFDQFSIDDLADRAKVSRSLLFHYFTSRQDFLVAVAAREAQRVLEVTDSDPTEPAPVRLMAGINGFFDYLEEHGPAYVALIRGAAGGDPAMQQVFIQTRATLAQRLVDGASQVAKVPPLAHLAARGQIALAEEVIVGWLTTDPADRAPRDQITLFLALAMVDLLRRSGVELDDDLVALVDGLSAASAGA